MKIRLFKRSFATLQEVLCNPVGIAVFLSFLTYPVLSFFGGTNALSRFVSPFSLSFPFAILLLIVTPLLSYTYIWNPLTFAIAILVGRVHRKGRFSRYVSTPLQPPGHNKCPDVSIHVPVYTEEWDIIKPTLKRALKAIQEYNQCTYKPDNAKARLVVSDDGLKILCRDKLDSYYEFVTTQCAYIKIANKVLTEKEFLAEAESNFGGLNLREQEGMVRLFFYVVNNVTVVARPVHAPGLYTRHGEFPKASNLNETLRIDGAITEHINSNASVDPEAALQIIKKKAHWKYFFINRAPRLGKFILILDKDSGTPAAVLTKTIPEFLADPSLAYTVHPTIIENFGETLVSKLVSPGANLYFNYWLPFVAHFGFLYFSGHNCIIRKEALRKIGFWPEDRIAEDYVACLRINQEICAKTGKRFHGLFVNFKEVIFSEAVPTRFLTFLEMIKKYTSGSFQMFLNPLWLWRKQGIFTEDVRSFVGNRSIHVREKLSAVLVFSFYLSMVPLVLLTVLSLHFIPIHYVPIMISMAVGAILSMNSPFWCAHLRVLFAGKDPFLIKNISAFMPLTHIFPAIVFHLGIPFYLFGVAAGRLLGEKQSFSTTSVSKWKGEGAWQILRRQLSVIGITQFLALCHLFLISIYLGKLETWQDVLRLGLCAQWGIATFFAPLFFDYHLVKALDNIHLSWKYFKKSWRSCLLLINNIFSSNLQTRQSLLVGSITSVILFALVVRLINIRYNAPYIDESFCQEVGKLALNGGPFHYPYISGAVYLWPIIAHLANSMGGPYEPRVVTAILGTVTTFVVYFLGKHLWAQWTENREIYHSHAAGILSAIFYSTSPSAIWISRIGTYDALSVAFLSFGFMLLIKNYSVKNKNIYFASGFIITLSVATSYSAIICVPFIVFYSLLRHSNENERIVVAQQFIVPFLFLLIAFFLLNYPYMWQSIINAAHIPGKVPHSQLGFISIFKEALHRMPILLFVGAGIFIMLIQQIIMVIAKTNPEEGKRRKKDILLYSIGSLSFLFYFLFTEHIFTLDRKLSFVNLFCSPIVAFGVLKIYFKFKPRTMKIKFVPTSVFASLLAFGLYLYANPVIQKDEQGYINMEPTLIALTNNIIPQLRKGAIIGYVSYENVWYLKQQLENKYPGHLRVDETVPWGKNWLERLEFGWTPDVIVGILASRYLQQYQQVHEEQQALLKATQYGYRLFSTVPVKDAILGESKIHILVREIEPKVASGVTATRDAILAYSPTNFNPEQGIYPNELSVRKDLQTLRESGFRGLVTYGAKGISGRIPEIARNEGFDGKIIMGIWDPLSSEEWVNALSQAKYVDGYCLGNEGLDKRYPKKLLAEKMQRLRNLTGKSVTTSERVEKYFEQYYKEWLLEQSDFIFPNVHPYWMNITSPNEAVSWTVAMFDSLRASTNKKVLFKEVGQPTGGNPYYNEKVQSEYYSKLRHTDVSFVYFEAFDQLWKHSSPVESHWGLYRQDRTPKLYLKKNYPLFLPTY